MSQKPTTSDFYANKLREGLGMAANATIYTVQVGRSDNFTKVRAFIVNEHGRIEDITHYAAAVLQIARDQKTGAVRMPHHGLSPGQHFVDSLCTALYGGHSARAMGYTHETL